MSEATVTSVSGKDLERVIDFLAQEYGFVVYGTDENRGDASFRVKFANAQGQNLIMYYIRHGIAWNCRQTLAQRTA